MIRSMTGYGIGIAKRDGHCITIELRAVNNRFLDLSLRIPKSLYSNEKQLREIISAELTRGRVTLILTEEWEKSVDQQLDIDTGKAKSHYNALNKLKNDLNLSGEITISQVLDSGDFFTNKLDDEYQTRLWDLTKQATRLALKEFTDICLLEGKNLRSDLLNRADLIQKEVEFIEKQATGQVPQYRERLINRLEEMLRDSRLDGDRLELEIALAADKLDISEELVRLHSHLNLFRITLQKEGAVGKSLGFILQEILREVNTVGSKSWIEGIAKSTIKIKEILEQIREQAQNIE